MKLNQEIYESIEFKEIHNQYNILKNILDNYYDTQENQKILCVLFFCKRFFDQKKIEKLNWDFFKDFNEKYNPSTENNFQYDTHDYAWCLNDPLFSSVSEMLMNISENDQIQIKDIFYQINTRDFNDQEFGQIYEYLLWKHLKDDDAYTYFIPEDIKELLYKILPSIKDSHIYNPIAGIGGLLSKFISLNHLQIHGSQINNIIPNMNLLMYGAKKKIIEKENDFWKSNKETFDIVIGQLPHKDIPGRKHISFDGWELKLFNQQPKELTSLYFLQCYIRLNSCGKAFLLVPDTFLNKKGNSKKIREYLIQNDEIETIISLPQEIFNSYVKKKYSILVINKNKKDCLKNKIKFIISTPNFEHNSFYDIKNIVDDYFCDNDNEKTKIIGIQNLDQNLNLLAEYNNNFSNKEFSNTTKAKFLSKIAKIISGTIPLEFSPTLDDKFPIVNFENLSKNPIDIILDIKNLSSTTNKENKLITEECILIANRGNCINPIIYSPDKSASIFIGRDVLAIIPKNESISIEFLLYFLKEQSNEIKKGKRYIKTYLENIMIPILSEDDQKKFIHSQKQKLGKAAINQLKDLTSETNLSIQKIKTILDKNTINDNSFELKENIKFEEIFNVAQIKTLELNQILIDIEEQLIKITD